tara:strand:- start:1678 stop:2529 length:852 start_codon:yes stop_codon:yes gene_type:complete
MDEEKNDESHNSQTIIIDSDSQPSHDDNKSYNINEEINIAEYPDNIHYYKEVPIKQLNNRCYWFGKCCYTNKDELDYFRVAACCYKDYPLTNFELIHSLINDLELKDNEKKMILWRIQRIYSKISCLQKIYKYSYFYSRLFIILASLLSPALTGINTDKHNSSYLYIWWVTWNLQLLISIVTSISTFFKWDRNYFLYSEYKDNIEEEVWHYLEGINEYQLDISNNNINNNRSNFKLNQTKNLNKFLNKLETYYETLCLKDSEIKLNSANNFNNKYIDNSGNTF